MSENTYEAQNAVLQAVEQGQLSEKLINDKCRKVLSWKYDMGLFANVITPNRNQKPLIDNAILEDAKAIDSALSYHLLTLLRNDDEVLPLNAASKQNICFLPCDNTKFDSLIAELKRHYPITIADSATVIDSNAIVLLAVGGSISQNASTNYGVSQAVVSKLSCLSKQYKNSVLLLLANPYVLKSIDSLDFKAIVVAYQTNQTLQTAVGKAIFENKTYTASLPVTASEKYGVGERYKKKIPPYDYSDVAKAGLDVEKFRLIDSIANMGVSKMAYPGCQIVVYKDSSLVFSRNYGYQTYDSTALVSDTTTYDLASLTKIFATTLSVMKLFEDGKLDLDDKLSKFLPYLRKTNKANITIKEVMSHFARLKAWYPFYKEQMQAPDSLKATYDRQYILSAIAKTELGEKNKYLYSDLGFILLGDLVEVVSKQPLDEFVWDNFYAKLGLQRTTFNPEGVISDSLIAPTENDTLWRRTLVRGQVHDQTSFLLGGVAGHAGLFSSAKEVAVLCHLLLYGSYDGVQYLKPSTIATFNHRYYAKKMNRRALGFDKPLINDKSSHCSKFASQASFGHSGFTGTYFWIDPEQNLIYVFLSNRVYPDASNNKLSNLDIRTNINDLIYEALKR
jgi:CubicO group peptidase (beta-lactamase class C family)